MFPTIDNWKQFLRTEIYFWMQEKYADLKRISKPWAIYLGSFIIFHLNKPLLFQYIGSGFQNTETMCNILNLILRDRLIGLF